MTAKTRGKPTSYTDCDGRLWKRGASGRYFHLLTTPNGSQYWIDSSYGNLVAEFGPLTPAGSSETDGGER